MILQLDFTVSHDSDIFYPGLLPVINSPEVDSEFLIMMHCTTTSTTTSTTQPGPCASGLYFENCVGFEI